MPTERERAGLREAARCVVEIHRELSAWLRVGQTLAQVDQQVGQLLKKLGCRSAFLHYAPKGMPPFPSFACLSLNECVVHGTGTYTDEPIKPGDVLKVDIGTKKAGWVGDAAWTYVFGEPTDEVARLCEAGKQSLARGVEQLVPGNTLMDWARTVQTIAEQDFGFRMIRGLGGHGYGRSIHSPPYVSNVIPARPGEWTDAGLPIRAGMTLAVEPMIAVSSAEVVSHRSGWPLMTADGSQSVHYEHDVLVTEDSNEVLTAGLAEIEDVIDR